FQNKLFQTNEKQFYRRLNSTNTSSNTGAPDIQELTNFWSNIWADTVGFNNTSEWIDEINSKLTTVDTMPEYIITYNTLLKNINKSHNWKTPGQDRIHSFWLKKLTTTHKYLLAHFNNFIQQPDTFPDYLSQGITFLKPKDTDTKNPAKYRP